MIEYTAVYIRDGWINTIITVLAEDVSQAREQITEQLHRPGRQPYFNQWEEGGKLIIRRDQIRA